MLPRILDHQRVYYQALVASGGKLPNQSDLVRPYFEMRTLWSGVLVDGLRKLTPVRTTPPLSRFASSVTGVELHMVDFHSLLPLQALDITVTDLRPFANNPAPISDQFQRFKV